MGYYRSKPRRNASMQHGVSRNTGLRKSSPTSNVGTDLDALENALAATNMFDSQSRRLIREKALSRDGQNEKPKLISEYNIKNDDFMSTKMSDLEGQLEENHIERL